MSLANEKVGHLNFMAPLEKSPIEHQHETSADEVGDVISDLVSTAKQEVERVLSMRRQLVSSQQTDNRVANSTGPTPTYRKNGEAETATVSFPPELTPIRRIATLHPLQEWEGRVVEIRDNDIVAMLTDITARYTHEHVEATIPISEISDRDAEHMVVGGRLPLGHWDRALS